MPISWKTYIFPYTLLNINPYLFSAIPLILFEILSPNEDSVGLFGAVIALFSVSMIGIYPLRTFIVNELAKALYQKNFFEVFKSLLFFSIGLSIILGIILWVTGPYLIMIFSTKYIEILSYYQAIIPTILMMTINGVFFSILKIEDQSEKFIIISIISALVIIVTSSYVLSNYYDLYLLICIYFSYILVKKRVTISKVG
jgi:O-antigen/teichoic acid export membrane protein